MTNPSTEVRSDEEDEDVGVDVDTGIESKRRKIDEKDQEESNTNGISNRAVQERKATRPRNSDSKASSSRRCADPQVLEVKEAGKSQPVKSNAAKDNEKMDEDEQAEILEMMHRTRNEDSENGQRNSDSEGEGERQTSKEIILIGTSSDSEGDDELLNASSKSHEEVIQAKKRKTGHLQQALKHHHQLKKTLEPFLQKKPCEKIKQPLGKCMECRFSRATKPGKRGKDICRFFSFRKLRYTTTGSLARAGFLNTSDCSEEDLKLWKPEEPPAGMTFEYAKYLLEEVGDQFCSLVRQEAKTLKQWKDEQTEGNIIWRKTVKDLRELCDVCHTTLFNYHWTCGKCGFVACVDCFNTRKDKEALAVEDTSDFSNENEGNKDAFKWLNCHRSKGHSLGELLLTQIIAKDSLYELNISVHMLRLKLQIQQGCGCRLSTVEGLKPFVKDNELEADSLGRIVQCSPDKVETEKTISPPDERKVSKNVSHDDDVQEITARESGESDDDDDQDGLLDLFGSNNSDEEEEGAKEETIDKKEDKVEAEKVTIPSSTVHTSASSAATAASAETQLTNFIRKGRSSDYTIKALPKRALTTAESMARYPTVKQQWLCQGNLLRLLEPTNPGNLKIFQEQWKRGQPVLVSDVASNLTQKRWTPESFSNDFGTQSVDLINCMTGKVVPSQKMKKFWDGFENVRMRLHDDDNRPMLLKLKDWPPGADFAKISPDRFADLMKALPLGEYTYRDGMLNLASKLPDMFSKPDLGPKMYIAYGSGLHLDKGTTNLHLDISDAVNVMVYVGTVKDEDLTEHVRAVEKAIQESDCDNATIRRVLSQKDLPGALWHIWEAKDADKIRDMCNKIRIHEGYKIERHHDAIHDQSWYLDRNLRQRLMQEYNVRGYPIVQCAGDAVFIPAGAPHQVRNLNNCIKIAEDFVSPENVGHCFHLTEEFRNLTDTHSNREDKLQIKNIVYHTVKDAVAVILAALK